MTQDNTKTQSFSRFGIAFFVLLAVNTILQYGTQFVLSAVNPAILDHPAFIFVLSDVPLYFIALPICLAILGKPENNSEITRSRLPVSRFLLAIVISFGVTSIGNLLGTLLSQIFALVSGSEISNPLIDVMTESSPLLMFLASVIIAPIGEELIFRYIIINRTRQYGEKFAIILSAAMFAAFHTNIFQIPYAFLVGLVFGYIYIKTGKIRYSILIHAIINFFGGFLATFLVQYFAEIPLDLSGFTTSDYITFLLVVLIEFLYLAFLLGCAVTTIILSIIKLKNISLSDGMEKINVFKSPFIMLFFALCLVLTILRIMLG